jgi:hypothetical protein
MKGVRRKERYRHHPSPAIRTIEQPRDQLPGAVFFSVDLPADTVHNRLMDILRKDTLPV